MIVKSRVWRLVKADAGPTGPFEHANAIKVNPRVFKTLPIVPISKYLILISLVSNNTIRIAPTKKNDPKASFPVSKPFLLVRYLVVRLLVAKKMGAVKAKSTGTHG